jgi:predicted SAM-dependent methyltransferase
MGDEPLSIDIGCGAVKRPGFVGVDKEPSDGVDYVVDVERDPLPFPDRSVGTIFTAHCFEHLADHAMIYREISRVAVDGATLEIWTPYAWTNEAFIYTHRTFFNEAHYLHPCYLYPEHWRDILGARWQCTEFQFVVDPDVLADLRGHGVDLDFALKYLKGVAVEFGTHIRVWHDAAPAPTAPARTYSATRAGARQPLAAAAPRRWLPRLRAWGGRLVRSPP